MVVAVVVLWLGLELFLVVVLGFRMNFVVDLVLVIVVVLVSLVLMDGYGVMDGGFLNLSFSTISLDFFFLRICGFR